MLIIGMRGVMRCWCRLDVATGGVDIDRCDRSHDCTWKTHGWQHQAAITSACTCTLL